MADEEAEQERLSRGGGGCVAELQRLGERLQELERQLRESRVPAVEAATEYCQQLCQTLLEYAEKWKTSEDPLPLLEVYTVAIQSYVKARPYLTSECENVALVLERLALSCVELLLCLPVELSDKQWEQFQALVQVAHEKLMENGSCELHFLATLAQETGVWKNPVLCTILSQEPLDKDKVNEFLAFEGPILLDMRIKHLIKTNQLSQATVLAKLCSDHPEIGTKGSFKQTYLVCLCTSSPNEKLIEEISEVDCKDALEMICNLESEGDEKSALVLCTAFLSRQLQQGEMYCAWELTLFWSKLQQRVEPSVHIYLERCRQLSLLTKTVYHIFFLIKVINSETEGAGLATCIELCVKALRLESTENTEVKVSICKTISCLLPDDLEVKRACQLSEFLIEPTVDAYYAVEMLYNQPDQKYDEENLPIPNSLRCELLLVLKTQWPFDPEFWDWKTLKRQCLALMGEEASIVSSIDELNDSEVYEKVVDYQEESKETSLNGLSGGDGANSGLCDEKQKKKEIKQLRERGFISARFRNWQAYMQYCVLCDKEFLGHRIVRHAQKHYKDGIYSCPICAKNFNSKETFVPHVTLHVKQSSKERLAAMKPLRRLGRPPKITTASENQKTNAVAKQEQRPIKKNSLYSTDFIVFNDNDGSDDENDDKDKSYEPEVIPVQKPVPVNEFNCPVSFCKKGFKYFKNLIAHVKGHKDNEDAKRFLEMQSKKVICQYCRRHFVSVTHLNDHLQMHCGSKPYICIQMKCKAGFNSYAELLTHRKEHQVFRAKCMFPKCGRIFSEAYLLYDHEAQHYNTYTCRFTGCGKVYRSQSELEKHLDDHSTPEKVLPPENQLNSSGASVQPSEVNQNSEGNTEKERSMLSENNIKNTSSADRDDAWDKSKAELAMAKQDQTSASELRQVDAPPSNDLDNPTTPLLQASEVAVSIKVSLNQGVEDNFGKQENSTVEDTGESLVPDLHTVVEDTCNDLCHPGFQEGKEQDCFNEAQITENSLVNSETLKIGDLTPQNIERQVNSLMTFSVQNQAGFQNSLPTSKFECGGNVKTSSSLYNLPLKTLESIAFVPPQPNLSSSLGIPSVPPKAPVQKFSCQVEGCTRTYNSSQSIGKHMKTAHPDQYAAFKMQCKSKKGQKSNNLNTPNNGKFVYFLPSQVNTSNNAFFTPQTKANGTSTCSNQLQHISSSIFPAHLASMSAPLLPSVESVINSNISSQDKNEQGGSMLCSQMENLSSTTLPAQMEDLTKTVLPLNIDSGSDPFLPLPAESSSMSLFPSPADSGTNSVFSQLENNANHFSSQIEGNTNSTFLKGGNGENAVFPSQVNLANDFSNTTAQQSAAEKVKKDRGRGPNGKERKSKHNKRAKWPAIIRDGKFICSRCYRAFTNPRSLGGHLSKRSFCKPLDGAEIAQELLQSNGQPSLLASMILSTNAVNLQQPQQSTFNPETCFKDPSFLQLLAAENRSSTFLPNTFPRTGVTNFNTSVSQEGSEIIKQALETAGIPSTFEGAEMLSHVPTGCVSDAAQVNATVIPNPTVPPSMLQTVCPPNSLLTNQNRTPNSKTPSIEDCSSLSVFPTNDLLLKTVENGLCSSTFPNSSGPSQNFTSNSSRVSVISGPQNTRSSHLNKKGNSASKRRKKVTPPLIAPNASQNLVTSNLTAVGLIAKSIEIPTTNLHSNVIPNCEPQGLVENLTQKLNSVDNQLFMTDIKENFKTNLESHTVLAPLPLKTENGDSQMMALNSCTTSINSDLQISEDNVIQNFEKTLEIIKSAMNSQIREVKSGPQGIGETSQNAQINYNIQLPSLNTVQNNKLPDSSQFSSFVGVMPTKSNIPQSELLHKEDQIQEILEGLQKLKLENDISTTTSQCVLINTSVALTPTPIKSIPNVTAVQPVSEMLNNIQFSDKVNKPFVCQNQGCNYSAMTKDALFKHYGKIHQYTPEMILEIKKNQLKFAPFKCVVPTCTKTFTRNSNLRAHCQLVHHFTTEEMVKLKIKRPYGRKSQSENLSAPRVTQVKRQLATTEEKEFLSSVELGAMKENAFSNIAVIPEKQLIEKKSPEKTESSSQVITVISEQCDTNSLSHIQTKGRKIRRHKKEKEEKKRKKPVSQSLEFPTRYSPYRPYRCVHQGCFAAFTIQQNLILHYQAIHKSDLPAFSAEVEEESEAGKESEEIETKQTVKEFRCQVSDCSRIFQAITGLIQHYMKLHEMTPEEIESMTASVDVGKFPCDQLECKSSFTTYLNYVVHLEADHGIGIRGSKTEEDGIYKCDCEGCDRIYATRSNLLRHIFNKHNDKHKAHLIRPRRLTPGQENMSSKANQEKTKSKYRGTKHRSGKEGTKMPKTKRKKKNNLENKNAKIVQIEENKPYSLKRGKHVYSIKARNDALSECTSKFVTQYPCMIKGCTSVVTSESNIIRHYKCHKLSKAFTSQHRNLLIVFKQCCSSQLKETSQQEVDKNDGKESDTCVPESNDNSRTTTVPQKEVSEKNVKDEMDELAELFITKLINEDNTSVETQVNTSSDVSNDFQENNPCQSEKQKASNLKRANKEKNVSQNKKRKVEKTEPAPAVELNNSHKEEETAVAIQTTEEHPASFDWSSFKPMGFEVSFLKFLEESAVKQKKNTDKDHPNSGNKRGSHSNSRKNIDKTVNSGNHTCSYKESETFVQFANPSQLQCSNNVKIVLDKTLKDCTELVLKQLQEMKPTVSLKKLEVHSNDPDMSVMKEVSMGKATGRGQY
ncbi:zinc finger protein 292 [Saccopteryx leptura]|uniref:zinc finger protein 292 n=1 Tax=Saccopteryx leptura TaxID=249018 RepID=UPI00339CB47B